MCKCQRWYERIVAIADNKISKAEFRVKFLFRDSNANSPGQLAIHCIAPGGYFIAEGTVADHFRAGDGLGR